MANKIEKTLVSLMMENEERESKIRQDGEWESRHTNITTDTGEIKIIMREYYTQLCDNKLKTSEKWKIS